MLYLISTFLKLPFAFDMLKITGEGLFFFPTAPSTPWSGKELAKKAMDAAMKLFQRGHGCHPWQQRALLVYRAFVGLVGLKISFYRFFAAAM